MHGSADHPEIPISPEHVDAAPPPAPPPTQAGQGVSELATEAAGREAAPPAEATTLVFRPESEAAPPAGAEPTPAGGEPAALAQPEPAAALGPADPAAALAQPEPGTTLTDVEPTLPVTPAEPETETEPLGAPAPAPGPVAPAARLAEPLAVHHIGVAVSSIDQAMQFYGEKLGLAVVNRVTMPERSLKVAFVRAGNTLIELLEPTSDSSTVARFIERRGPGLHHLCFGTPDIAEHLRDLKDKGVELIDDTPRPGGLGSVAFIQPSAAHGVLVELLQERLPDAEAPY